MTEKIEECKNRVDPDDDESFTCGDEGRMCPECLQGEAEYWAEYFGLKPGMSKQEYRDQLERMKPRSQEELREIQIEAMKYK